MSERTLVQQDGSIDGNQKSQKQMGICQEIQALTRRRLNMRRQTAIQHILSELRGLRDIHIVNGSYTKSQVNAL